MGSCAGNYDMIENAQAEELERIAGCPLINGFHGFWSLGTLLGALLAGAAAFAGVSPLAQFALAAVVAVAGSALFLRDLPDTRSGAPRPAPGGAGRLWLTGVVVAVAAISFCAILVEGVGAVCSALYLGELSPPAPCTS